jgi:hypothetical protein
MIGRLSPARRLNDRVLVVSIPVSFQQTGGRKQIVTPPGSPEWRSSTPRCDSSLINAVAKAHKWRTQIETGRYTSAAELARKEGVNESYVCRILRLTLLAPDIVEAILNGRQPKTLELQDLLKPQPLDWLSQRTKLGALRCSRPVHSI